MADKITWADKESLVTDPTIAEKNKVTDDNMNEIKSVTNTNADQLDETIVYDENDITANTKALIKRGNYRYMNSEIDNQYGTATNRGYSQAYTNSLNTYSTDEIRIGTFLGKPLYRKTIVDIGPEVTTMGTAAITTIDIGTNLSNVMITKGYVKYNNNTIQFPLYFTNSSDVSKWFRVYAQKSGTTSRLVIQSNSTAYSELEFVAVVEYTKTTD